MFEELTRRWWIVAARGVISIALGIALFMEPTGTMWMLVSMFALLALADGVFAAGAGLAVGWLPVFLEGVVGMAIGLFTFVYPAAVEVWFVGLVVTWAVVTGGLALIGIAGLRHATVGGSWLLGVHGVASLAFGVALVFIPRFSVLPTLLGAYALIAGISLVGLAVILRGMTMPVPQPAA